MRPDLLIRGRRRRARDGLRGAALRGLGPRVQTGEVRRAVAGRQDHVGGALGCEPGPAPQQDGLLAAAARDHADGWRDEVVGEVRDHVHPRRRRGVGAGRGARRERGDALRGGRGPARGSHVDGQHGPGVGGGLLEETRGGAVLHGLPRHGGRAAPECEDPLCRRACRRAAAAARLARRCSRGGRQNRRGRLLAHEAARLPDPAGAGGWLFHAAAPGALAEHPPLRAHCAPLRPRHRIRGDPGAHPHVPHARWRVGVGLLRCSCRLGGSRHGSGPGWRSRHGGCCRQQPTCGPARLPRPGQGDLCPGDRPEECRPRGGAPRDSWGVAEELQLE
mmetsp:Transcript_2584/g.8301  ORF Transcript_2584/g.8301 Transcript_2584/m.8301 type:complete len:333 (-) Transcript_2584:1405-2403(-)